MDRGRIIAGYIAAVLVAFTAASFVHTHFVVAGLRGVGAEIPTRVALATARGDFTGLVPSLGPVIALALLLGFLIAGLANRFVKLPRPIAFAMAGGAAIAAALWLMGLAYDGITPLASARTWAGFLWLCAAGALGGLVFATVSRQHRRPA